MLRLNRAGWIVMAVISPAAIVAIIGLLDRKRGFDLELVAAYILSPTAGMILAIVASDSPRYRSWEKWVLRVGGTLAFGFVALVLCSFSCSVTDHNYRG